MIKKTINIISNILFYITLAILLIYFASTILYKMGKIDMPSFLGYYVFDVASGSMENGIHIGDYIIVKKTNEYNVGDIVTYEKDGYYVTHRIIKIEGDKVTTKGDANNTEDEEFNRNQIIGRYIKKSNALKFIINTKYLLFSLAFLIYALCSYLTKE